MRFILAAGLVSCTTRSPYIPEPEPDTAAGADSAPAAPDPEVFAAVSAGGWYTCAIRVSDHGISCWWADGPGRLADFGQTHPPEGAFAAVSAGMWHACAIDLDGGAHCWGQAGGKVAPPDEAFDTISAGMTATCGRTRGGDVRCWADTHGGDLVLDGEAHSVSVGPRATCAARSDGTVDCAGGHVPSASGDLAEVATGAYFACGRAVDGTLSCWGDDRYGQLRHPAGAFSAVTVGVAHACALSEEGALSCWGDGSYGQLDAPSGVFAAVDAGTNHACALDADGGVSCWGSLPDGTVAEGEALSHDAHIQPIWDAHCLGCHAGDAVPKLSLLRPAAHDNITGASWREGLGSVTDPDSSRLVFRMRDDAVAPMPPTHAVPDAQVERLVDWMAAGMAP